MEPISAREGFEGHRLDGHIVRRGLGHRRPTRLEQPSTGPVGVEPVADVAADRQAGADGIFRHRFRT